MNERVMTNDRERFIRFMRAMNTIDGEYAALMHGLRVKESLFVLLYACLDEAPRSQKRSVTSGGCRGQHSTPRCLRKSKRGM